MTTAHPALPRVLIGSSTKSYLDAAGGRAWGPAVVNGLAAHGVPVSSAFICPALPLIPVLLETLGAHGGLVGAQDVSPHPPGAFTGEVSADLLAGLGVRMVMAGHPERRRLQGETDELISAKVAATAAAGMAPVLVVGESDEGEPALPAIRAQLENLIGRTRCPAGLVVAYEPTWAIGRAEPAPAAHVVRVIAQLRTELAASADGADSVRLLYGGSAQPGTFTGLVEAAGDDPTAVPDGVFLGRAGVDPASFVTVADEVWKARRH